MALFYTYIIYVGHVHPAPFYPLLPSSHSCQPCSSCQPVPFYFSCLTFCDPMPSLGLFSETGQYTRGYTTEESLSPPIQLLLHINTQGRVETHWLFLRQLSFYDRVLMRPILCRSYANNPSCCGLKCAPAMSCLEVSIAHHSFHFPWLL